jgi:predicted transcriptional regulator
MVIEAALSRREREVLEILLRLKRGTAQEIRREMDDPPTDAAVRSTLRILVEKGHLVFESDGPRYVYSPSIPAQAVRRSALEKLTQTFFEGSTERVMSALLESRGPLTPAEKRRLKKLIDEAAEEGR